MLYERSLGIEQRLQTVLQLISSGSYSTPELAEEVGVSVPTISRDVQALRERGYAIAAQRQGTTWHYTLKAANGNKRSQSLQQIKRKPR